MSLAIFWLKFVAFIKFYAVGTYYMLKQLVTWSTLEIKRPEMNNDNPVALVTGGSKGVGFELAKLLAQNHFKLVLVARNKADGDAAVAKITKINPKCHVEFHSVDLSKMNELKAFVDTIKRTYKKIHLLINNAAVMIPPYKLVNGVEFQWATNVVAPIYLCESLVGLVTKAADEDQLGRIVNVGSSAMFSNGLTKDSIEKAPTAENYSPYLAYANTKLAVALYTEILAKDLIQSGKQDVIVTCMHPGVIITDLYRDANPISQKILSFPLIKAFFRSASSAAKDILYLSFVDEYQLSKGKYYENGIVVGLPYVNEGVASAFREYVKQLKHSFNL